MSLQEPSLQNSEEWKPIPEFTGYMVSNTGNVKSLDREVEYIQRNQYGSTLTTRKLKGRMLKPRPTVTGYLRAQLSKKDMYIHRLVAQAFIGSIEGMEINHKDGNKRNNTVGNLEIVTRQENHDHAVINGLNTTAGLTRRVCINGTKYNSVGEASRALNISPDAIIKRLNGDTINTGGNYKYNLEVSTW